MGLIHWWPLNGTLEDNGYDPIPLVNIGAEMNRAGKIGKTYITSNTNRLACPTAMTLNYPLSMCGWFYPTNVSSTNTQYIFSYNTGTSGSSGHKIGIGMYGSSLLTIWCGGEPYPTTFSLANNTWYHVAVTVASNQTMKCYVNGLLVLTQGVNVGPSSQWITIGGRSNSSTGGVGDAAYYFAGRVNDLRIYDHELSMTEVKEIARGLILHYDFENYFIEGTNNLGNTSATYANRNENQTLINPGSWGGIYGTVTYHHSGGYNNYPYRVYHRTACGSGGFYDKTDSDIQIVAGKTYTVSCYLKCSENVSGFSNYSFNINRGSDNYYITYGSSFSLTTEWRRLSFTFTATSSQAGMYGDMSIIYGGTSTQNNIDVYYSGFQVEEKDHATPWTSNIREGIIFDSSGYNRHGLLQNNQTNYSFSTDTMMGTKSFHKNNANADDYLLCDVDQYHLTNGTICFWYKKNSSTESMLLCDKGTGYYVMAMDSSSDFWHGNAGSPITYVDGVTASKPPYDTNWHFYCASGINLSTWDHIRFGNHSTDFCYHGNVADIKIYATALSASDILAEYQRKASIDRNQNLHTGELVQNGGVEELLCGTLVGPQFNSVSGGTTGLTTLADGSLQIQWHTWMDCPRFEVIPGETLYWDIVYSNESGDHFYVGFEKYNVDGGTDQNQNCHYIINTTAAKDHERAKGSFEVVATVEGKTTKWYRLRVLNGWESGSSEKKATIHSISLRRVPSVKSPNITKTSIVQADDFREYNYNDETAMYKNGFIGARGFIEE